MRAISLAVGATLLTALIGGCSSAGHSTTPTVPHTVSEKPTASASQSMTTAQPVPVNKSVVLTAPGGAKVRVSFVSYLPKVAGSSGDELSPNVFEVNLSLTNLSDETVRAHAPTYYAVLTEADTAGASAIPRPVGQCGGTFSHEPIQLAPHASAAGCIPYSYGNAPDSRPVRFGFGFGSRLASWSVRL